MQRPYPISEASNVLCFCNTIIIQNPREASVFLRLPRLNVTLGAHRSQGGFLDGFLTMTNTTAGNPVPRCEFETPLKEFKKNAQLSADELKEFTFADINGLRSTIKRIQTEQEAKRRMRNMKRLEPFLQTMEQYGQTVDVFVNTSEILAFVWVSIHQVAKKPGIDLC